MINELSEIREEINSLKKRIESLEDKKTVSELGKDINTEILIKILDESIENGIVQEDYFEYLIDKKVLYNIASRYGIKKYSLNKNLFKIKAIMNNKDTIYTQRRINGKNAWLFVINKEKWLEELKKVNYGR